MRRPPAPATPTKPRMGFQIAVWSTGLTLTAFGFLACSGTGSAESGPPAAADSSPAGDSLPDGGGDVDLPDALADADTSTTELELPDVGSETLEEDSGDALETSELPRVMCANNDDCPEGLGCWRFWPGNGVCLPVACETHADCATDLPTPAEACCTVTVGNPYVPSFSAKLEKVCALAPHGGCDLPAIPVHEPCDGFLASCDVAESICQPRGLGDRRCAPRCNAVADCAEDETCENAWSESIVGSFGVCTPKVQESNAFASCNRNNRADCGPLEDCVRFGTSSNEEQDVCLKKCNGPGDCPSGTWCAGEDTLSTFLGWCMPDDGTVAFRESCAHDPMSCQAGLLCVGAGTPAARCSRRCGWCGSDESCHVTEATPYGPYTWTSWYSIMNLLSPFDGCIPLLAKEMGESCVADPVAACGVDFCQNLGDMKAEPECTAVCGGDWPPCDAGFGCSSEFPGRWGMCLEVTDDSPGAACDPSDSFWRCGPELWCDNAGGESKCRQPCAHDQSAICATGEWCGKGSCLPSGAGVVGAPCPAGASDCIPGLYCTDLVDGTAATCQRQCQVDQDCGPDMAQVCHPILHRLGVCAPAGPAGQGEICAGDRLACDGSTECLGPREVARCASPCTNGATCPNGSHCSEFPAYGARLVCAPHGEAEEGGSCADDFWDCASGLVCVVRRGSGEGGGAGAPAQSGQCAKPCGGSRGGCADGRSCQVIGAARSACLPVGEVEHGGACDDGLNACSSQTRCVSVGEELRCMTPCLAGVTCPEGTACEAERKGPLRYCVAPDEKIDAWQWAPW